MTTAPIPKTLAEIKARLDELEGVFRKPVDLGIFNELVVERQALIAEYRRLNGWKL